MNNGRIYILSNKKNGTLYIGVTNNLTRRIQEHKDKANNSFSSRYNLDMLVYYEQYDHTADAIQREKQLKKGNRARKVRLIEEANPEWIDLADQL